MKKLLLLLIFFQLFSSLVDAQKVEMSLNAGTNLTFVPGFQSNFIIFSDLTIPGLIVPGSAMTVKHNNMTKTEATPGL